LGALEIFSRSISDALRSNGQNLMESARNVASEFGFTPALDSKATDVPDVASLANRTAVSGVIPSLLQTLLQSLRRSCALSRVFREIVERFRCVL
jgi:hypothetical protein